MSRIGGGGGPPKSPSGVGEQPADLRSQEGVQKFRETAAEVCPGEVAVFFIDRAERIAESFQLGMFFRPDQPNSFPVKPAAGSDPA